MLSVLRDRDEIPARDSGIRRGAVWSGKFGEEEFLRERGVDTAHPPNVRVRQEEGPVAAFAKERLNSTPTASAVTDALPGIRRLLALLREADAVGVDPVQRDHAWGTLAEACSRIPRLDALHSDDVHANLACEVLRDASEHSIPESTSTDTSQFDETPSWGSPGPRIEAAEGLIAFGRHADFVSDELLDDVRRLAADEVPAVRYQIARSLNTLYENAPDFMWQLARDIATAEQSRGVLQALLGGPLDRLAGRHPDRVVELTRTILSRVLDGAGAAEVRRLGYGVLAGLYVWRGHEAARLELESVLAKPAESATDLQQILHQQRPALTHADSKTDDTVAASIRARAQGFLNRAVEATVKKLADTERALPGGVAATWSEEDQEGIQRLYRTIDAAAGQLYFAAKELPRGDDGAPNVERLVLFYEESAAGLSQLSAIGLPSATHYLLETLEFLVSIDPKGVFLRISEVVLVLNCVIQRT